MDRIATFHVVRERRRRQPVVLARMLTDRWRLRHVDGLEFAKVLGTGRGRDTGPSADLRRQAYFLVWRDVSSLDRFLSEHVIGRRWTEPGEVVVEQHLRLRLLSGDGTWSQVGVLVGLEAADAGEDPEAEGDIVVLTRARIRLRYWRTFRRASRATAPTVERAPGLRWSIGIGELPIGLLGTVSCWRSAADLEAFARTATHTGAAIHAPDWFTESLFARFEPEHLGDPAGTSVSGAGAL